MNPATAYRNERRNHWDALASTQKTWLEGGKPYHKRLDKIYSYLIPPGKRVLEVGCGCGGLLASVKPSFGVGVDFSRQTLLVARKNILKSGSSAPTAMALGCGELLTRLFFPIL